MDVGGLHGVRAVFATLAAAGALAFAYGVNAVADRASDRSSRKNPLAGVAAPGLEVVAVIPACAVAACAAAAALGPTTVAAVFVSLACGLAYSLGPRLKATPVAGLLCNTGIFVPLMAVALAGPPASGFAPLVVAFVLLIVQNQLLHEIADAEEDEAAGDRNTARLLGPRRARTAVIAAPAVAGVVTLPLGGELLAAATLTVGAAGAGLALAADDPRAARCAHRLVAFVGGGFLWLAAQVWVP